MARSWPFVGRDEELAVIAGVLADSGEQRGVMLAGRAGVGKSRLAREALAVAAAGGWAVRWVAARQTARSIPLGAFAAWVGDTEGNPLAQVHQVIATITASADGAPLLVVLDDMHLLDDLSAFVLHQLVLQGAAWVIGTVRSGEAVADAVRALWKDGYLRYLEVQALSNAETAELLTAALGGPVEPIVGPRVWRLSAGNALLVRELVEQERAAGRLAFRHGTWRWDGPAHVSTSLIDLVDLQIGAVSDAVGEIIDLVTLGDPIDRSTLAAIADPAALEEAEQRGLITVVGGAGLVNIGHPLYGEVRLAKCGQVRLRRLRGRLATALSGSTAADPVRLGLLWLDSDLPPDPDVFLQGAHAAFLRIDLENAQRLADAAVAAGAGIRAQLLLARALILLIRSDQAEQLLAALDAAGLPEPVRAIYFVVRAANLLWSLADPPAARGLVNSALRDAEGPVRQALSVALAVQLAVAACPSDAAEVLLAIDESTLDGVPAAYLGWAGTIALGDLGRVGDARATAERCYGLIDCSVDAAYEGLRLTEFEVTALLLSGQIPDAVAVADRTHARCADVPGIPRSVAAAIMGLASLGAGHLLAAHEQVSTAIADFECDTSGLVYRFVVVLVELLARTGRVAEAQSELERMTASRHPAFVFIESDALLATAWVHAAAGRMGQARHNAARAAEFARDHRQWAREVWCLQTSVGFGDTTVGARLAELAAVVEGPRAPAAARYAAALAGADGPALAAVSEEFEAFGERLAAAEAAAHAATAFTKTDRRGSALSASHRAARLAAQCGMVLRPGLRTTRLSAHLSGRQHEIAVLLAQGLSNNAVAEALTMSVRTVEGHIYRACTRLGLSRTELTQLVAGHTTVEDIEATACGSLKHPTRKAPGM